MKNFHKLVRNIIIGIDRIDFSMPLSYLDNLLSYLDKQSSHYNAYVNGQYWYKNYILLNHKVKVRSKIKCKCEKNIYNRVYVSVFNPDKIIQEYLKSIFDRLSGGINTGTFGIIISQIEISYDFYSNSSHDIRQIKRFIDCHLLLKFARKNSYRTVLTTDYIGRNGNIRKGAKGSRSYCKFESGRKFYRFEMQFNRAYILKRNITFFNLPLNPIDFRSFDYIDIVDNFSFRGIKNISRSILRKKCIHSTTHDDFERIHREMIDKVRFFVVGGRRGKCKKVSKQITMIKCLKKEYNLSINHKKYFTPLNDVIQLINCLADIGYKEELSSKRIILLQGLKTDN